MEFAKTIRIVLTACLLASLSRPSSQAGQVTLDHSLGQTGQSLSGPSFNITPGNGKTIGHNLFFSFAQFDLSSGDTATFSGPNTIQNILSRVTSGNPSSIDGLIRSTISGANFFFINPKGIIFGPNAKLDVSGSFAASTADYLKLADGARFVAAVDADDSTLSSAPVSAFGFLGGSPGSIAVQQSALSVSDGKGISLVGGDISVDGGSVQSPAGQINMVSVQSAGEAPADPTTLSVAAFNAAFPRQGEINLQNGAQVDASGDGGGRIVIRGGALLTDNSLIQANTTGATDGRGIDIAVVNDLNLANGGQINSLSTMGLGAGGNISITAGSIRLDGGGLTDDNFNPTTQISAATGDPLLGGGLGKGGDIVIQAARLELVNSAQISSASFGAGNAGRIEITASSVRLDALLTTPTQVTANSYQNDGGGNAGDIVIHTGTLDMLNGATLLAATFGSGNAGLVDIDAKSVNLLSGAIITAGTFGAGSGGNIQITAGTLRIDGQETLTVGPDLLTGIQAVTTADQALAPGGGIQISAGSLELQHMGSIFTDSFGSGPSGNVEIKAGSVTLTGSSTIKAAGEADGPAGGVSVQVDDSLKMTDHSALEVSAANNDGGDISVTAGKDIQVKHSQITAEAAQNGGNIELTAARRIYLLHSPLSANAHLGNGGNITFDPTYVVLNNSPVTAQVDVQGNGGMVTVNSDFFFTSDSPFNVSTPSGIPGTVVVTAPTIDLSASLVPLPSDLIDAESLLRPDCGVRLAGNISSFVVLGRGGLPLDPGGFVPSSEPTGADEGK
ncbi:MAG TPA: filamentous hemagglutinin N-terminal domain-containing protein [Verrucomicrobiae bacterium]|nr:filamentous hemagglutinin N-terminal domain-containing protein [Verrucomicrobiae bacterium]